MKSRLKLKDFSYSDRTTIRLVSSELSKYKHVSIVLIKKHLKGHIQYCSNVEGIVEYLSDKYSVID